MELEDLLIKNDNKDLKVEKLTLKDNYVKVSLIDLNDKYNLSISIDDYYDLKIKKDDYISYEKYDELKKKESILLAYRSAIRRIGIKDYSIKGLSKALKDKYDLSENELKKLINKLIELDYLNDERFTKSRINSLIDQGHSKRMIYQKLINEGINSKMIDKYYPNDLKLEIDNIERKVNKLFRTIKNKSIGAKKSAIYTKLVSAGFDSSLVNESIDKLDFKEDYKLEDEKLEKEFLKAINKYSKKYESYELKNRLYTYLMSKGFRSEDINKKLIQKGY